MSSTVLQRLYIYQKERFPVVFVFLTTLAVVLSSFAVTNTPLHFLNIFFALLAAFIYILHIRIVDEIRDYQHDLEYHKLRPIPRGIISLQELKTIDLFTILIFTLVAIQYGFLTFFIGLSAILYTFFASQEFFMYEKIRSHFLLYNAVNIIQIVILQLFVYALFSPTFYDSLIVWIHLLFIFINSIILEILRKIKIKSEESLGHDTYSWHLGFKKSLWLNLFLATLNYLAFLWLIIVTQTFKVGAFLISFIFIILVILSTIFHLKNQDKRSERDLYLSAIMMYTGLNLIIYILLI